MCHRESSPSPSERSRGLLSSPQSEADSKIVKSRAGERTAATRTYGLVTHLLLLLEPHLLQLALLLRLQALGLRHVLRPQPLLQCPELPLLPSPQTLQLSLETTLLFLLLLLQLLPVCDTESWSADEELQLVSLDPNLSHVLTKGPCFTPEPSSVANSRFVYFLNGEDFQLSVTFL